MKKILSVVLAVMMLAAMMVTVNAANNDAAVAFVPSTTDITVGDTFTVAMVVTGDTDDSVVCLGGSFKLTASSNVSIDSIEAGDAASGFATQNIYTDFATKKQNINDQDGFSGDGELLIVTFTALEAGTFTLTDVQTKITFKTIGTTTKYNVQTIDDLSITIKEPAPAGPVEQEVTGAAIACAKTWVAPKSAGSLNTNEYINVAVATAKCEAGAKVAGFRFVKDDVNNTAGAHFVVLADAEGIKGDGEIEYTAVMYGVEYDSVSTIYALPYYVIVK